MKEIVGILTVTLAAVALPSLAQDAPESGNPQGFGDQGGRFQAGGFGGGKKHQGMRGQGGMKGGLGKLQSVLNENQKTEAEQIMKDSQAKMKPLFEQMRALRQGGSVEGASGDTAVQNLREQIKAERQQTRQKIMQLLTPEQKTQLKAQREQRKGLRQQEAPVSQ